MPTASIVANINSQALQYLPAVIAAIQAVELLVPEAPGSTKFQAVMTGLGTGTNPNQTVAGVAELVNLSVLFANLLGVFKRSKTPVVAGMPGEPLHRG